jgi:SHS2 domain-containing protein
MHEHFEHTADLGLRIVAPDLDTLFAEAAECLFAAIVENPAEVKPNQSVDVALSGSDREYLLFDWLRELLRYSDQDRLLFSRFEVKVQDDGLIGTAWGEPLDASRHNLIREVKAITYHELKVEPHDGGWLAEVIVDI